MAKAQGGADSYSVRVVGWEEAQGALRVVRERVFVEEQGVPIELERDGLDATAVHVLAEDGRGQPVGAARMLPEGRIGRMAVLQEHRGRGVGRALLEVLLVQARARRLQEASLTAQTHAIPFYGQYGFQVQGGEFLDAGLPHRLMVLTLSA